MTLNEIGELLDKADKAIGDETSIVSSLACCNYAVAIDRALHKCSPDLNTLDELLKCYLGFTHVTDVEQSDLELLPIVTAINNNDMNVICNITLEQQNNLWRLAHVLYRELCVLRNRRKM